MVDTVLILGSGPNVLSCRDWPKAPFEKIIAINNAWSVRPDWDDLIYPHDFAPERRPKQLESTQRFIAEDAFVPAQNAFGGFVYAGGTMAFTAAYWALYEYRPKVIAFLGCDMIYSGDKTHFYGKGKPDPLRQDITLRSLEAKSARLQIIAALEDCATVNLSPHQSRLLLPRSTPEALTACKPEPFDFKNYESAITKEAAMGYFVPSGRYWEEQDRFDPKELDEIDQMWLAASGAPQKLENIRNAG